MLLAKDINTLFITDEGKPIEKRQIPWQSAPESIGYSYPYIVALQPPAKGSLEVRNPDTLSLLQTISLPGAAQMSFPPPTGSLAHAGKGFHISSERVVWKMDATDYDSQVHELVSSGRYDEAISVLIMLEDALLKDKTETLREVKMQKADILFKQKKYRESMDLFNEDEVHAPPERVLRSSRGSLPATCLKIKKRRRTQTPIMKKCMARQTARRRRRRMSLLTRHHPPKEAALRRCSWATARSTRKQHRLHHLERQIPTML